MENRPCARYARRVGSWTVPVCRKAGTKVKFIRTASLPASTTRPLPSKKAARMGDKAKPSGRWGTGGFAVRP